MTIKKTVEEMVEGLTIEMRQGFKAVDKRFDEADNNVDSKIERLAIAVQQGFVDMKEEVKVFKKEVNERFDGVETRLDRIEFSSSELDPRISVLKRKVQKIGTKLGLQS